MLDLLQIIGLLLLVLLDELNDLGFGVLDGLFFELVDEQIISYHVHYLRILLFFF